MSVQASKSKFMENTLLVLAGILAQAPLSYQVPRWAMGLDPVFVHQRWIESSPFPLILHMATVHPLVWICIIIVVFGRICRNYGWRLENGL